MAEVTITTDSLENLTSEIDRARMSLREEIARAISALRRCDANLARGLRPASAESALTEASRSFADACGFMGQISALLAFQKSLHDDVIESETGPGVDWEKYEI